MEPFDIYLIGCGVSFFFSLLMFYFLFKAEFSDASEICISIDAIVKAFFTILLVTFTSWIGVFANAFIFYSESDIGSKKITIRRKTPK